MAYYMLQVAYTGESWAHQIKNPQNVVDRTRTIIERLGGSFEDTYYAFGDYDLIQIVRFPENVSAASLSMAIAAGGAVKAFKTTPLLTVEEGMEAFRKAGSVEYRPPL
jgi:uncharacterized protein with GYD domain